MSTVLPDTLTREWTVLIYMAGDNNLSEECVFSLTEIKDALPDSHPKLAVLAQFDPSGVLAETKRYLLRSNKFTLDEDAEQTGWKVRETNTGEPQNLLEFLRWGISQYPANHFMVVLVGHGSGTDDDFFLRDENLPDSLSILELQEVFTALTNDGHTIDIVGMDTCLMNMAEICYELNRTSITYLVGSEGFSPNTGWPYAAILRALEAKIRSGGATPKWLAVQIVEEFSKFYQPYINGGISVDQSVLEIKKINGVKDERSKLVTSLLIEIDNKELDYTKPKQNALVLAHWETQSYNGEVFVDLSDFCDRLEFRYNLIARGSDVAKFCGTVKEAIKGVVVKTCLAGAAFQFSFGVSIYFPWAVLSPKYGNLSFPKETGWLDFLKKYHDKTRRPSRPGVIRETGRASIPINKGRDGRVESMRNPPSGEFIGCPNGTNGDGAAPTLRRTTKTAAKKKTSQKK